MICYTLSDCVLEKMHPDDKESIADFLTYFVQKANPCTLVVDDANIIVSRYKEIAATTRNSALALWLQLMAIMPSSWESVTIDTAGMNFPEEIYLRVCSHTLNKKLIVHSHNGWSLTMHDTEKSVMYNGIKINVLDRDEAANEIPKAGQQSVIHIYGDVSQCQIATGGGLINDSDIKRNEIRN